VQVDRSEICEHCRSSESGVYYVFNYADQIEFLFEQQNLADAIDAYKDVHASNRHKKCLCDILDGTEYPRVKEMATGPYDII